ncbi:hypothetical protein PMIN06_003704 [Paraphaeosphaeria minitans]
MIAQPNSEMHARGSFVLRTYGQRSITAISRHLFGMICTGGVSLPKSCTPPPHTMYIASIASFETPLRDIVYKTRSCKGKAGTSPVVTVASTCTLAITPRLSWNTAFGHPVVDEIEH